MFYWCLWCWRVRCVYVKYVGDGTPPCGTPVLNWCCVDVLFLNLVYDLRLLNLRIVCGMESGRHFWGQGDFGTICADICSSPTMHHAGK